MKDYIEIDRKKYNGLLSELSTVIILLEACYMALQYYGDEYYEKETYANQVVESREVLGNILKDINALEKNLRNIKNDR